MFIYFFEFILFKNTNMMYGQPPGYGSPPPPIYQNPGYQQPSYDNPYGQPAYGQSPPMNYGSPGYNPVPPPNYGQNQGPTIIHINNDNDTGTPCQFCGTSTDHITRRSVGCVAIAWGCCLFYFTGILCCLPCCIDGCKDVELICTKCHNVKNTIQASCC